MVWLERTSASQSLATRGMLSLTKPMRLSESIGSAPAGAGGFGPASLGTRFDSGRRCLFQPAEGIVDGPLVPVEIGAQPDGLLVVREGQRRKPV